VTFKKLAQFRSTPVFVAGDSWFESCHPDQYLQGATFPGSLFFFVFQSYSDPFARLFFFAINLETLSLPSPVHEFAPVRALSGFFVAQVLGISLYLPKMFEENTSD
jgi:hypothetical protein